MTFEYEMIDFGSVKEGESFYGRFAFLNFGAESLEIEFVSACDCVEAEWSKGPILHQQKGEILIFFKSKGEGPDVLKTIDVLFKNTDAKGYPLVKQLYLKGMVQK